AETEGDDLGALHRAVVRNAGPGPDVRGRAVPGCPRRTPVHPADVGEEAGRIPAVTDDARCRATVTLLVHTPGMAQDGHDSRGMDGTGENQRDDETDGEPSETGDRHSSWSLNDSDSFLLAEQ